MSTQHKKIKPSDNITILKYFEELNNEEDISKIIQSLKASPKSISSKYFYDARGSRLFEMITYLDEYYQPDIERRIIEKAAGYLEDKIAYRDIVEIGSGDSSKISIVLNLMNDKKLRYIPFDISQSAIEQASSVLTDKFENLNILGMVADFNTQLEHIPDDNERFFCFFGSTLGNLSESQSHNFFRQLDRIMKAGEGLLLGIDRVKPVSVLERAYNDSSGITEQFNKNILNVINNILERDFQTENFEHMAFYNRNKQRIEMHLSSRKRQKITSPYLKHGLEIGEGEMIHTENSQKFTIEKIEGLISRCNLKIEDIFSDPRDWFSLLYIEKTE